MQIDNQPCLKIRLLGTVIILPAPWLASTCLFPSFEPWGPFQSIPADAFKPSPLQIKQLPFHLRVSGRRGLRLTMAAPYLITLQQVQRSDATAINENDESGHDSGLEDDWCGYKSLSHFGTC